MRKKKFTATAVALAMAAITVFSVGNTPSVKAADVTDNAPIDLKIDGNYQEKQISKADSDVRPYAFVENVVTHGEYREKGYATDCLNFAKKIAEENHCYKIMLLTGSKEEGTLKFYRNAGYNSSDKTAFIQWIDM